MKPAPGILVSANVRLVRELGRGGMGCVWVADHLTLGTQVAVKLITEGVGQAGGTKVARFRAEARAAAKVTSPHVVRIFDQGVSDDGTPFIVMELLTGESLGARLERGGPLSPPTVAELLRQIGSALGAAHELGIVHRDIKPENIFLVDVGGELFVKVLDFGIAKQSLDASSLTATDMVFGTPTYMSPEQLSSAKHVDLRADLWALGVVTYQALTGKTPFDSDSLLGICLAIQKGSYPPATQLRPELPPALDGWFARALARELAARFDSARALAEAFVSAIQPSDSTSPLEAAADEPAPALMATVHMAPQPATPVPAAQQPYPVAAVPAPAGAPTTSAPLAAASAPPPARGASAVLLTAGVLGVVLVGAALVILLLRFGAAPTDDGASQPTGAATATSRATGTDSTSAAGSGTVSASGSASPGTGMVEVAAGSYWVGCQNDVNRECYPDEKPAHQVTLQRYALMEHEVTVAQYRACVAAGACPQPSQQKACGGRGTASPELPVTCVDAKAAAAYCGFRQLRLPTEAEWEVAALGTAHRDFPWGSDPASCGRTVMGGDADECAGAGPAPGGSRAADRSWIGAFDLAGNVREWTSSDYRAYPGGSADASSAGRVNRGGSFAMTGQQFDTTHTRRADPADLPRHDLGVRCAADL